jgi:hypothetical protein
VITKESHFVPDVDTALGIPGQRDRAVNFLESLAIADIDLEPAAFVPGTMLLPTGVTFGTAKVPPSGGNSAGQDTVVISDAFPDDNYLAIMRTKLLAQMGARTAYDVNRQTDQYYARYTEILGYCGWVQNYGRWSQYQSSSSTLEISTVLVELLEGLLTGPQLNLLETALSVLKAGYSSNDQVRLLGKDNAQDRLVNFDLGVVGDDWHGWPTFKPVFFAIEAASGTTNILFTTLKTASTKVFYATADLALDMEHYATVRAVVEQKTEQAAKLYIENLPISD